MAAYGDFIRTECEAFGVSEVVARNDAAALLEDIGVRSLAHSSTTNRTLAAPSPNGFDLVQYTSGSTGRPKAVALDDKALGANVAAMLGVVEPRPGDVTVSWLPLSHDLGLVGMLLTSTAAGDPDWVGSGEIVLLEPDRFLRRPRIWLDALDHWAGTFTASPDFGYRLVARRRPSGHRDLSRLRCAIMGGEVNRAGTVDRFAETFAADGLVPEVLCPSYGMAELGLAASITPPDEPVRIELLDTRNLGHRRRTTLPAGERLTHLVSSGRALSGSRVAGSIEPGSIDVLRVMAPAIGRDPHLNKSYADDDGWLTTGDLGYVDEDGWVFVCGRADDHIIANGRPLYAPDLEVAVSAVAGVRDGRVTVVDSPTGDWLVAVEREATVSGGADTRKVADEVRRVALAATSRRPTDIVVLRPGHLPMTSSGKVQRGEVRRRWLAGLLAE